VGGRVKRSLIVYSPTMEITEYFQDYTDKYNLVQPGPIKDGKVGTSQNGLLTTGIASECLKDTPHHLWVPKYTKAIISCQLEKGLYKRSPTSINDQESHDDYRGIALFAFNTKQPHLAKDVITYGRRNLGFYNNTNTFRFNSWLWRFPDAFYCLKIAANIEPNCVEKQAVEIALTNTTKNPTQDGRTFQFITCRLMPAYEDKTLLQARDAYRAQFEGDMRQNLNDYYNLGQDEHPNAYYLDGRK